MNLKQFTPSSRAGSIRYAINGLVVLLKSEANAWIHALATILVIVAGFALHITPVKWIALIIAICMVWVTEALNTALEKLCDFSCDKKYYPEIKIIKDISAGAVLITALASVAIAIIVFTF